MSQKPRSHSRSLPAQSQEALSKTRDSQSNYFKLNNAYSGVPLSMSFKALINSCSWELQGQNVLGIFSDI